MAASEFDRDLEANLFAAIEALESERFYDFTHGLRSLLDQAKHKSRLLNSILDGVAGVPRSETEAELERATAENDW